VQWQLNGASKQPVPGLGVKGREDGDGGPRLIAMITTFSL
jgi:hypothetical protein